MEKVRRISKEQITADCEIKFDLKKRPRDLATFRRIQIQKGPTRVQSQLHQIKHSRIFLYMVLLQIPSKQCCGSVADPGSKNSYEREGLKKCVVPFL
jgi:hypothetical protein